MSEALETVVPLEPQGNYHKPKDESAPANAAKVLPRVFYLGDKAKAGVLADTNPASIVPGQFYFKDAFGARKFDPFRIVVTPFFLDCYVDQDEDNKIVRASFLKSSGFTEYREALVLVPEVDESKVHAAVLTTQNALGRLWDNVGDALAKAGSNDDNDASEWISRFPQTAKASYPEDRVVATIWGKKTLPKTSGGRPYNLGFSKPTATSAKLIETLIAFRATDEWQEALNSFNRKANWLQRLAAKG